MGKNGDAWFWWFDFRFVEVVSLEWGWGMLTIRTCKVFSHALGEYLRQADYYSQGMKVDGRCFWRLCEAVGLVEGATI